MKPALRLIVARGGEGGKLLLREEGGLGILIHLGIFDESSKNMEVS